jgi:isopenicillin N synthase-like dioxygenase
MALPIPVIDISGFDGGTAQSRRAVLDQVMATCEDTGFLVITGHRVAEDLIADTYRLTRQFFLLPAEEKERCTPAGWDRFCGFAGIDKGRSPHGQADLKEMFHANRFDGPADAVTAGYSWEVGALQAPNLWPEQPSGFVDVWRSYYHAMEVLADRMNRIFACCLGLPEEWFGDKFDNHLSNLGANWYPPQPVAPEPGAMRGSEHIDFSALTILYQDDAPGGLEVRDHSGQWRPVPPLPGSFVVNLGDLMNRWTSDRWQATPHRVVNPPREVAHRDRISIPYFQMPNWNAVIECVPTCVPDSGIAHYPPVVAGPHAEERRAGKRPQMAV